MNFTLKMCNGELFTLEKAVGCSTTANGLIVFFSDFGEKIRCTKISDGMKDLIYYRKDVTFILENIDAIYLYNTCSTNEMDKEPLHLHYSVFCCSAPEFISFHDAKRCSVETLLRTSVIVRIYTIAEGGAVILTDDSMYTTKETFNELRRLLNA